jgi:hypothetical protein
MQRREEDNQIVFLIRPDGKVEYYPIQSTSAEMHVDLVEIAEKTKAYMEGLLRAKLTKTQLA